MPERLIRYKFQPDCCCSHATSPPPQVIRFHGRTRFCLSGNGFQPAREYGSFNEGRKERPKGKKMVGLQPGGAPFAPVCVLCRPFALCFPGLHRLTRVERFVPAGLPGPPRRFCHSRLCPPHGKLFPCCCFSDDSGSSSSTKTSFSTFDRVGTGNVSGLEIRGPDNQSACPSIFRGLAG